MKGFYISFCLLLLLLCIYLGCSTDGDSTPYMSANGKIKVISTTAMIDDLVGMVGGEEIDHISLIQGNIDPHSYELVKGDGEKLMRADLLFFNGLGLELGASLKNQLEKHPRAIALGDLIYEKNPSSFIFVNGQIDPHIWMDIALFSEMIAPIVQALEERDPSHAELFRERGDKLKEKMLSKDRELFAQMQKVPPEKRFLVTSHDAFHYFVKKYLAKPGEVEWEERLIAPEGLAPDGQMSTIDIKKVVDFLHKKKILVIFSEVNISQNALKKIVAICRERGLNVTIADLPLFGDTMGAKGKGARSHLDMVEHNIRTLIKNLE